jgi:hypothetical protein
MTVLKRRDRIVVFRLTQDEYKLLEKACSRTGARNLSDYTRARLLEDGGPEAKASRVESKLLKFDKRLGEIQVAVGQITRLLRQLETPEPARNRGKG